MTPARRAWRVAVLAAVLAGCETTVESPDTTAVTTTIAARVVAVDPFAALAAETAALSATLIDNEGETEALARIEELWGGLRPEVARARPELVDGFETVIGLARRAVERRRPADADKAHKNLLTLIAAYQG